MKKLLLISFFLFAIIQLQAQTINFDDFITLQKPDNVSISDTIASDLKVTQFLSDTGSYVFLIVRLVLDPNESEINRLPYDSTSLEITYQDFIRGFNKPLRTSGFNITDSLRVHFNGFIAYKINANKLQEDNIVYESLVLILDKYAYAFSYIGPTFQGENRLNGFLNSITINKTSKPSQTVGNSPDFKMGYLVGQVLGIPLLLIFLFFVIKFIRKRRN